MAFYEFRKIIRKLPGRVIHEIPLPRPAVTQGFGARVRIGPICKELGLKSVLLVTDQTVFRLGFHEKVTASLEENGVGCTVFHDIDSEPTVAIVEAGREAALACGAEGIVALGGGSVLDSSKVIAASAKHLHGNVHHYLHKFALAPGGTLPLIMVPTTAGTGAEHTVGTVVKGEDGTKHATVIYGLNVGRVILDSELMVNAPRSITVWCGIDALSHGLEGLLSDTESGEEDVQKSLDCVKLTLENLPLLLEDPQNVEARQHMCTAAYYGGNAINTQLAGYVHAFAHSIGGLYHIPHGKAIAHCLLPVVEAQKDLCIDRLAALSRYCGCADETAEPAQAADRFLEALQKLLTDCGLEPGCAAIQEADTEKLIRMVDADSINYSPPKTFRDEELKEILDHIRRGA